MKNLAKLDSQRQVQVQDLQRTKHHWQELDYTILNRHTILSIKLSSRIDRHVACASNNRINDHFTKLCKVLGPRTGRFTPKAITNVDEKGFAMGWHQEHVLLLSRAKKTPV